MRLPVAPVTPVRASRSRRVWTDVAKVFSTVCNPFVTPLALFVLLTNSNSDTSEQFWFRLSVAAFFTSIGPMLFVLWLYASDRISDLDMSVRTEREKVFGIFVVFYLLGAGALWAVHAPTVLVATMAGYTASAFIVQQITRYWKISTHAVGITAPLVALYILYGARPLPFFVLIPILGWSRIYLRAHTPLQVLAGTALGALSVVIFFRIFHLM